MQFKTIKEALQVATNYLKEKGISNPILNAELLLADILNLKRTEVYLYLEKSLTFKESILFKKYIKKRGENLPLQYILGKCEFRELEFIVNENVLIPRPETEILVETALTKALPLTTEYSFSPVIVDLGTGCGNIALSLAKELPPAQIYATDISLQALEVAFQNAKRHHLNGKIIFSQGDLFAPLEKLNLKNKVDILISNPPYIPTEELEKLPREVRKFEPQLALDGGEKGLDFYERIIKEAPSFLKERGFLILEIGLNQAPLVNNLIKAEKRFSQAEIIKDYTGRERIICAQT